MAWTVVRRGDESEMSRLSATRLLRPGRPRSALTGFPLGRGEDRRKKPDGARARCARVRCRHTEVPSANLRSVLALVAGHDARRPRPRGCPFSWLLLFGQAKKVTRSPGMASGKTHGRGSALAKQKDQRTDRENSRPHEENRTNHRRKRRNRVARKKSEPDRPERLELELTRRRVIVSVIRRHHQEIR